MAPFLIAAGGMFATMYSTQAILPDVGETFDCSESTAGLSVSAVVFAVALTAFAWGRIAERVGRTRALRAAGSLLVVPTILVPLAPSFTVLIAARLLQGVAMSGVLVAAIPYVAHVYVPRYGAAAMGYYAMATILSGLVSRLGIGVAAAAVGWRTALGALAALPIVALVAITATPAVPAPVERSGRPVRSSAFRAAVMLGAAMTFSFQGVFSYVTYRLQAPPFRFGSLGRTLVYAIWVVALLAPAAGRLGDRLGWRGLGLVSLGGVVGGAALSIPARIWSLVPALAFLAISSYAGTIAAQLGVGRESDAPDRASSAFFSAYYLAGALGAYLPGLAFEHGGWPALTVTVVAPCLVALPAVAPLRSAR
jgi:YNFM family putative membrane transporter